MNEKKPFDWPDIELLTESFRESFNWPRCEDLTDEDYEAAEAKYPDRVLDRELYKQGKIAPSRYSVHFNDESV